MSVLHTGAILLFNVFPFQEATSSAFSYYAMRHLLLSFLLLLAGWGSAGHIKKPVLSLFSFRIPGENNIDWSIISNPFSSLYEDSYAQNESNYAYPWCR